MATYSVVAANPSTDDVLPGSKYIDEFAMIGEGGALVADVASTNGDDGGLTSRGGEHSVREFVTSCDLG